MFTATLPAASGGGTLTTPPVGATCRSPSRWPPPHGLDTVGATGTRVKMALSTSGSAAVGAAGTGVVIGRRWPQTTTLKPVACW
jgi:hypothetical protein